MAGGPNTALENGIFFTLFDLLCTAYQKDWYYSFWTVNFRDDLDFTFRLGDLNNARVLFFIASWMDFILTSFLYSWYLAIPRASNTVSTMDSSAHTLVFNRRSSGQSSSKGLPKSLSVSMRLCLLLETQLCSQLTLLRDVKTVCHFLHSHSRTLQYIWQAQDHIRIIQRLKATGFSVSPITPPFPFTRAFSCSCTWSSGIFENLLRLLDATHLFWNSSFRGAGT